MQLIAIFVAFLVTFVTAPPVIRFLRAKKYGQQIRDDGPQRHLAKAGTPTMGGVVILAGLFLGTIVASVFLPPTVGAGLATAFGCCSPMQPGFHPGPY
jgi:phospho-N-acetylmuramoyl-pentapeptide-transferase